MQYKYREFVFDSDEERIFFIACEELGLALQVHKKSPYIDEFGKKQNKTIDFYWQNKSSQIKIVIECDGNQHKKRKRNDNIRDDDLRARGIVIFRFTAQKIRENAQKCAQKVQDYILIQEEILRLQARARKIIYAG